MTTPPVILDVFAEADFLARQDIPYRFGGGHPDMLIENGLDCSSAVSRALEWKANLLGSREALDTHGLERWGDPGQGTYMTVWVINSPDLHHCFLELKASGSSRFWGGRHTGTLIGWFPYVPDTAGYTSRRRKA